MLTVVGLLIAHDADRAKPATAETDDLIAFAQTANGDRTDRGIQTRHIPAAGENTDHALLGVDVRHIGLNRDVSLDQKGFVAFRSLNNSFVLPARLNSSREFRQTEKTGSAPLRKR